MKSKHLTSIAIIFIATTILAIPVLAKPGNGPKHLKHVASLLSDDGVRFGQVIFNENPEDDETYELEVEVEKCLDLADSIVDVKLNGVSIGSMYIDVFGNGKETFYVDSISEADTVSVEGDTTLKNGLWRPWVKGPGSK